MHGHKTSHLPIRYFLALLWAHPILHISRIRVKSVIWLEALHLLNWQPPNYITCITHVTFLKTKTTIINSYAIKQFFPKSTRKNNLIFWGQLPVQFPRNYPLKVSTVMVTLHSQISWPTLYSTEPHLSVCSYVTKLLQVREN